MEIINIRFERLSRIPVSELLGRTGTYVIWDSQAKTAPTYIGEGNVLSRLVSHLDRFVKPIDGYVACQNGNSRQQEKSYAEIVEAVLIEVARETDRRPRINVASGKLRALDSIYQSHGVVRVNVRGYDPFAPPRAARRLSTARVVTLRKHGTDLIEHDWRRLRSG
jgi:hypothetical protein